MDKFYIIVNNSFTIIKFHMLCMKNDIFLCNKNKYYMEIIFNVLAKTADPL